MDVGSIRLGKAPLYLGGTQVAFEIMGNQPELSFHQFVVQCRARNAGTRFSFLTNSFNEV